MKPQNYLYYFLYSHSCLSAQLPIFWCHCTWCYWCTLCANLTEAWFLHTRCPFPIANQQWWYNT